jgi:putative peptide zinc metalloprotease protein
MDLPRPAALNQLRLSISAEGRGFAYYVADLTNGKILSISRAAAAAFMRLEDVVTGRAGARDNLSQDQAKEGVSIVSYLRSIRDAERLQTGKFNPMSIQLKLFDVGRLQPMITPLANWLIGWPVVTLFVLLTAAAVAMGTQNNWAIASEFKGFFNLEALLVFGLIAPFLKIVHEFGHVIVATRFKVRVRQAGVNLIGLYPLPYVDCTEADLTASRLHRVLISLAGIATDFLIGLVAFMVWHLADSDKAQSVAGQLLAFSTMSSLLFNANPLMKFDGYYVFVDLLGQRNLYTRATKSFGQFRTLLTSFGASGAAPRGIEGWAVLLYGSATFLYRFVVLYALIFMMLPQYLGFGAVLAAWGAYVMFLSPLMSDSRKVSKPSDVKPIRRWANRLALLGIAALILFFIKLPFILVLNLQLDREGRYAISANTDGFVIELASTGAVLQAGSSLLSLRNQRLEMEGQLLELEAAEADLLIAAKSGSDAAQAMAAQDKRASIIARQVALEHEMENLQVTAPIAGLFIPEIQLRQGHYVTGGVPIGAFYPASGNAQLIAAFPERLVETYQEASLDAEIWALGSYYALPVQALQLVETLKVDASTGVRAFTLKIILDTSPADLLGKDIQLRLNFGSRSVISHLRFWFDGQVAAFRDAQLADKASSLR